MSAPTASQSENIGDNIAAGFVTVLTQDTTYTTLAAFGPRMPLEMPKNRIEVRSGGFIRANDLMNFTATGTAYYNYRRGTLSVTVITQRHSQINTGISSQHGAMVGRVRYLLSRGAQKMTAAIIGGYGMLDIIDQGDNYRADETTETDRTELRFQIDLVIPPANYLDS
jgi:hypothetical protein